jgi:hypothetical protein
MLEQEFTPWTCSAGESLTSGLEQVTDPALLRSELSGVAAFVFGFFTILIIVGGSVLFTYWISKDE